MMIFYGIVFGAVIGMISSADAIPYSPDEEEEY